MAASFAKVLPASIEDVHNRSTDRPGANGEKPPPEPDVLATAKLAPPPSEGSTDATIVTPAPLASSVPTRPGLDDRGEMAPTTQPLATPPELVAAEAAALDDEPAAPRQRAAQTAVLGGRWDPSDEAQLAAAEGVATRSGEPIGSPPSGALADLPMGEAATILSQATPEAEPAIDEAPESEPAIDAAPEAEPAIDVAPPVPAGVPEPGRYRFVVGVIIGALVVALAVIGMAALRSPAESVAPTAATASSPAQTGPAPQSVQSNTPATTSKAGGATASTSTVDPAASSASPESTARPTAPSPPSTPAVTSTPAPPAPTKPKIDPKSPYGP